MGKQVTPGLVAGTGKQTTKARSSDGGFRGQCACLADQDKPHSFWKWMAKTGMDHLGKRRAGGTELG